MKNNGKVVERLYKFSILLSLLIFFDSFLPWLHYNGTTYTIIGFYRAMFAAGGIAAFAGKDFYVYPAAFTLFLPALAGMMSLLKAIMMISHGRRKIFAYCLYGIEWIYIAIYFAFTGYDPTVFAFAGTILTLIDFLVNKLMADYKELSRQNKELRLKEKQDRKERQCRLAFPGKYPSALYSSIGQMMKPYRAELIQFVMMGSLSVLFLFEVFGLSEMLSGIHSAEPAFLGSGLQRELKNALVLAVISSLILLVFSYSRYSKIGSSCDTLLMKLGVRSSLLNHVRIKAMIRYALASLLIGFGVGTILLFGVHTWIASESEISIPPFSVHPEAYLGAGVLFVLIVLAVALVQYDLREYLNTEKHGPQYGAFPKPVSQASCCLIGFILLIVGICFFMQRRWGESLFLLGVTAVGILFLLYGGTSFWLKRRICNSRTVKKLSACSLITHYKATVLAIGAVFLLQFVMMGPLSSGIAVFGNEESYSKLFPYDHVCIADEQDRDLLTDLQREGCRVRTVRMVRITSVEGSSYSWKDAAANRFYSVLWPQCQHIGVSEEGYKMLCRYLHQTPAEMNLEDDRIWVVFQEGPSIPAHPIDYYGLRTKPYLRIGQPLRHYSFSARERLYPPRNLQGENRQILTGMLNRGMQENIIVLSDSMFRRQQHEGGPSVCWLVHDNGASEKRTQRTLERLSARHLSDVRWDDDVRTVYDRKAMEKDLSAERFFRKATNIFSIAILLICSLLILLGQQQTMQHEWEENERILVNLGIPGKTRRKLMRKDYMRVVLIAESLSMISALAYLLGIAKLRMFSGIETGDLFASCIPVWLLVIAISTLVFALGFRSIRKKMNRGGSYHVR